MVRPMGMIEDLIEKARSGGLSAKVDLRREVGHMLEAGDAGRAELGRFLRRATPRDWIAFDESMRAFWYDEDAGDAPWWRAAESIRIDDPGQADVLGLGLASMFRDGRVREAAVRRLGAEADDIAGPFLALRTTDWVDQVAIAAVDMLTERIRGDTALLIASAPVLFALTDRQRRSGIEIIVLERAASDSSVRATLFASTDTPTRRRLIGDRHVREAATRDELVRLATTDPDTIVSSTAGVEAVSRVANEASSSGLDSLLSGPSLVRRAVLEALGARGEGRISAERHLFDRSPAVRSAAQRAYRASGGDAAAIYRSAFEQGRQVPIAVIELAHTGSSADRERVLETLKSQQPATRRAAVNAARWIAGERLAELITPLLWDSSPGVTRAVERRLRAKARDLDAGMLSALSSASRSHNRRAAYRLMRRRSDSERLEADFMALADTDEHVRWDALADLGTWLHRKAASARRGDLGTRQRLSRLLDTVEPRVPPDTARLIRFHAGLRQQDLQT